MLDEVTSFVMLYVSKETFISSVFVSWGCHNTVPLIGWLKTTHTSFLWFWGQSVRLTCPNGHVFKEAVRQVLHHGKARFPSVVGVQYRSRDYSVTR
jgi:hypothetical protein